MFINIDDVPTEENEQLSNFSDQLTDLDSLEIDEDVYTELVHKWGALEYCFNKQLIAVLPETLTILLISLTSEPVTKKALGT